MSIRKSTNQIAILLAMMLLAGCGWNPSKPEDERKAVQETIATFKQKDPAIKKFFRNAYAYAVFPSVGKGGMVVGGAWGKGKVLRHGRIIGSATLSQATIGFQLGGQVYSEIIFFRDRKAFERFKSNHLEFDAQVSAVLVTAGAAATAAYSRGVAVFVLPRGGLMYEATVGGQSFTFEPN
jgi:lipid-binding SYLF domain-containing protein